METPKSLWQKFQDSMSEEVKNIWKNPETAKVPKDTQEMLFVGIRLLEELTEEKITDFLKFVTRLELTTAVILCERAYKKLSKDCKNDKGEVIKPIAFSSNKLWVDFFKKNQSFFGIYN